MATYSFSESKSTPKWKEWDSKANKQGPHHTVYWVKGNPKYATAMKNGKKLPSRFIAGNKYTGDWAVDKREGFGTQIWENGNKYEGDWKQNLRHGKGTYWIKDGKKLRKQYTGDWWENQRNGLGIFYYKTGNKYEGEWRWNVRHGRGKMVYLSGDVYEGDWVDDKRSGLGVLTLANGDRYEGHWLADRKEGPGRYFYRATNKMYEGEWVDDVVKCGVYMDMPEDPNHFDQEFGLGPNQSFTLPPLQLENPGGVMGAAVENARRARAAQRGMKVTQGGEGSVFSREELQQLRGAFMVADPMEEGTIAGQHLQLVLEELGMAPIPEDLDALLSELGASMDSRITFEEFVGVLARLKM